MADNQLQEENLGKGSQGLFANIWQWFFKYPFKLMTWIEKGQKKHPVCKD